MTADIYVSVLTNHIVPRLCQTGFRDVLFHQGVAPPYYVNMANAVLDKHLPTIR